MSDLAFFWHRRDLRIEDNSGLYKALNSGCKVQPVFIFDTEILSKLENQRDRRITFIYNEITRLKQAYIESGSDLWVLVGNPVDIWDELVADYRPKAVYTNRDYEPYAKERDSAIFKNLERQSVSFIGSKDQVIFEKSEVVKDDGSPYLVFTPYMKKWKEVLRLQGGISTFASVDLLEHLNPIAEPLPMPAYEELGFEEVEIDVPSRTIPDSIISHYHETRDIPSLHGTSKLSVHLRFGTISIRQLAIEAQKLNEKYLNELIWRDFYQMILHHYPDCPDRAIKPAYDRIEWENNADHFKAWSEGKTGYPLVDAGMRELNETGYMHNRVRMVVASFLTKHLLLDWRLGERYFAEKLLDYDLASNVGGWQWAAGSGCDAAPYFRIFNPTSQLEKFDPDYKYVRKWVPEYGTSNYPKPIVDHKWARERALSRYKSGLAS